LAAMTAVPIATWTATIGSGPPAGRFRLPADDSGPYPPEGVGNPLADAENHYVATCHKVGI
jgi:hypothetical protein